MELHHIGYLVKDMERAVTEFCALGYQKTSEIVYDAFRDIRICFLSSKAMPHGGVLIELVMPVSDASVVASLAKNWERPLTTYAIWSMTLPKRQQHCGRAGMFQWRKPRPPRHSMIPRRHFIFIGRSASLN